MVCCVVVVFISVFLLLLRWWLRGYCEVLLRFELVSFF